MTSLATRVALAALAASSLARLLPPAPRKRRERQRRRRRRCPRTCAASPRSPAAQRATVPAGEPARGGDAPRAARRRLDSRSPASSSRSCAPISSRARAGRVGRVLVDEGQSGAQGPAAAGAGDRVPEARRRARRGRPAPRRSRRRRTRGRDFERKQGLRAEGLGVAGDLRPLAVRRRPGRRRAARPRAAALDLARQRLADATLVVARRRRRRRAAHRRRRAARRRHGGLRGRADRAAQAALPRAGALPRRACASGLPVRADGRRLPGEALHGQGQPGRRLVDPQTRTFLVEAEFPNRDGRLPPGPVRPGRDLGASRGGSDRAEARRDLRPAPGLHLGADPVARRGRAVRLRAAWASTASPRSTSRSSSSRTVLVGAAPEEMETEVTDKIEEAVNTISGIDELQLDLVRGRRRRSSITFDLEKNADVAAQEVRDRVNSVLRRAAARRRPAGGREDRPGRRAGALARGLGARRRSATSPSSPTRRCAASSSRCSASARSS